jgi:hypothetical protein
VKGLSDDLVGGIRTVEVCGIDVVDPEGDCFAQYSHGAGYIARGPENPRTGELHGTITQSMQGHGSTWEGEDEVVSQFHGLLQMVV